MEALNSIISSIDARDPVNYESFDVYTLVSVLKEYVRSLPETLIPSTSYTSSNPRPQIMTMDPRPGSLHPNQFPQTPRRPQPQTSQGFDDVVGHDGATESRKWDECESDGGGLGL